MLSYRNASSYFLMCQLENKNRKVPDMRVHIAVSQPNTLSKLIQLLCFYPLD
uniref:Uncharacterized protein n=1 Tax=Rhizophora mucronata TaxID=61149 RepID=A0A2P2P6Y9_RHIMU